MEKISLFLTFPIETLKYLNLLSATTVNRLIRLFLSFKLYFKKNKQPYFDRGVSTLGARGEPFGSWLTSLPRRETVMLTVAKQSIDFTK